VQLIFGKGKWQSLPWLIRAASVVDEPIAALARRLIEEWFSPPLCNKVFTRPATAEQKATDEAIEELRRRREDEFVWKLQGWLRAI
jgi:hypothetical protein